MRVKLNKVGKRFNKEWILKNLSLDIPSQSSLSITGANGSGKSTLIKLISAYMEPTLGEISNILKMKKTIPLKTFLNDRSGSSLCQFNRGIQSKRTCRISFQI